MIFRQLFDLETSTYTYLIADAETGEAVIIDSVIEQLQRDLALVKELDLKLKFALDTHVHADHITGLGGLRDKTGCKTGLSWQAGASCADLQLREGDALVFGKHKVEVLETPGHTDSCLTFKVGDKIFTGDALFIRGCGRTDFQDGNAATLYESVTKKIFTLPDTTFIYPGHDYKGCTVSTVGEEKRFNPRLTKSKAEFVQFMADLKLMPPQKIMEAVPANKACGKL